ncbi:MAG TPA: hypothetical protein VNK95_09325, partial [Caldilineaceae bacterium]|nr:hypothetical protein [Caldilineaceae bacterium]
MHASIASPLEEEIHLLPERWLASFAGTQPDMPELIQAARLGDELAFSRLVDHYQAAAQRLAQQILRTEEAAADAVQDALIKVHRA